MNKKEILEKIKEKKSLIKLNGVKRLGLFGLILRENKQKKAILIF
jgi:predicted nucleotidyltransferase